MLGGVVLDLVEGGERGLNAAGCFIGERGRALLSRWLPR